ncbi:MAG: hypothetical protein WCO94_17520 [Verrucomicrobiota bacterium]
MKKTFLVFGCAFGILLLAAALCPSVQATPITVTITGTTGTGRLLKVEGGTQVETQFPDSAFVWTLTYDPASYSGTLGPDSPIFLHAVSVITIQGISGEIRVTQEHGLYVWYDARPEGTHSQWIATMFMVNGELDYNRTNMLLIEDTAPSTPWTGFTSPFQSSDAISPDFNQCTDVSTDKGLLSFSAQLYDSEMNALPFTAGTVTSVTASAGGTPYSTWVAGITWNGGDSTATADPDHDGLSNLMEYALGGNPVSAQSAVKPQSQVSGQKLQISFLRARSELTYTVQGSSNLTSWTDISYTPVAQGATQVVTDTVTLTGNAKRFLRLQVTLP